MRSEPNWHRWPGYLYESQVLHVSISLTASRRAKQNANPRFRF